MVYNLSTYIDFNRLNDLEYVKEKHLIVKFIGSLILVKYDKQFLTIDNVDTLGLMRSLIYDDRYKKVICFSPPKSKNLVNINTDTYNFKDYEIQNFIEGTMINVFWNNEISDWEIATRSNIGGKCCFNMEFNKNRTFRYMFLDAMNKNNIEFEALNPKYSYSFILQHPKNRIVVPIKDANLFLSNVYEITNDVVNFVPKEKWFNKNIESNEIEIKINTPGLANLKMIASFKDLIDYVQNNDLNYKILGYILYNNKTGERIKIRNKNYEYVRHLKGNTPKIQYQYYYLRQHNKVKEFLSYYPEVSEIFNKLRNDLHTWTNELQNNYFKCFVKKEKPLKEYPHEYKPHMYQLHKLYIDELREKHSGITKTVVINYVNNLPPPRLMYSVNYKLKEFVVDEHKINVTEK
jgi:hypothetical protein